jgi:Protein of unknown function (DUF3807)
VHSFSSELTVSQEDLAAFHAGHFSADSTAHFAEQFLGPAEDEYEEYEEHDDLGYYEDGIKRTLTDEQIAIFRHSEIETLLRARRHAAEAKQEREDVDAKGGPLEARIEDVIVPKIDDEDLLEDGELGEDTDTPITDLPSSPSMAKNVAPKNKGKKTQKPFKPQKPQKVQTVKQKSFFKQNVKPDLRKRTWDKVDTGLESLDYDEDDSSAAPARPIQRRRIAYDDD